MTDLAEERGGWFAKFVAWLSPPIVPDFDAAAMWKALSEESQKFSETINAWRMEEAKAALEYHRKRNGDAYFMGEIERVRALKETQA